MIDRTHRPRNRDRAYTLERWTVASDAICLDCDWERHDEARPGWLAARAAARRHAATTGHVVHVDRLDRTVYAPEPPDPATTDPRRYMLAAESEAERARMARSRP